MYSILKSQKRSVSHAANISITSSQFVTNNHILLTFSNNTFGLYTLKLLQKQQQLIYQGKTAHTIVESRRIGDGMCVLMGKNMGELLVVCYREDGGQGKFWVEVLEMDRSHFGAFLSGDGVANAIGCQLRVHGFQDRSFVIQYFVYQDRKIVLDCYKYTPIQQKKIITQGHYTPKAQHSHSWKLHTLQFDIELTGHYVIDCLTETNQLALYKQSSPADVDWHLRIISPFIQLSPQMHNPSNQAFQTKIPLPQAIFNEQTLITQITSYLSNTYLVITSPLNPPFNLQAYTLPQPPSSPIFSPLNPILTSFLSPSQNFIRLLHINPKQQIFYSLVHRHQYLDGQLYLNGLSIGNLATGKAIEKGYCTMRNVAISADGMKILDVPYEYDKICGDRTLYHVRLLLSKNCFYMSLIQGGSMADFGDGFKNAVLGML